MKQITHHPSYHDVVTLCLPPDQRPMRVIITAQGPFQPLINYFRRGPGRTNGPAWQRKAAHAIGLLFDYTAAFPPPSDTAALRAYLQDFIIALEHGTVDANCADARGLYWLPAKRAKVREVAKHVIEFTDHLAREHRIDPVVATVPATLGERLAYLRHLDRQDDNAMLRHLRGRRANSEPGQTTRDLRTKRKLPTTTPRPPSFPDQHFRALIEGGFGVDLRDPSSATSGGLRDALIAIMQRCGGVRASEALHVFLDDIDIDRDSGAAQVLLAHPEEAQQQVELKVGEGTTSMSRAQYLKLAYSRLPRTELGGREHIGWKGCEVDKLLGYRARLYWAPTTWGVVFAVLYREYLRRRPRKCAHPYLFVAFRGDHAGQPYALAQYHANLAAAVKRIALQSNKALGTTSHGLRHAYLQTLVELEIAPEDRKLMVRHSSLQSQEAYTRSTHERIQRVMTSAGPRMSALDAGLIPPAPLRATLSPPDVLRRAGR